MSVFSEATVRLAIGISSIESAIVAKGGTVVKANTTAQIEELATGVGTIVTGGGGTIDTGPTTHEDYFAYLEGILAVTRTDLTHRAIVLVDKIDDTFTNSSSMGNVNQVWVMSDGATYTGSVVNHTWDKTKDDACPMGRWILQSFSNTSGYVFAPNSTTYCVLDNAPMISNSCFKLQKALLGIKMKNQTLTWPTQTSISYAGFYGCGALAYLEGLDVSNITNLGTWAQVTALRDIVSLTGPKVNLILQTDTLTTQSLLNLFNGLATVTNKTLTIGAANLSRLTEADKTIATAKGWTLA